MTKWVWMWGMATLSVLALADAKDECHAAAGKYIRGVVVQAPTFHRGHVLNGVELSHTLLSIKADKDGKVYQVAMDNVFASGYDAAQGKIPAPLNQIALNDHLELCGEPFPNGIHWVHTNCGKTPNEHQPNGWVKKLDASGRASENFESSTEYCKLWH